MTDNVTYVGTLETYATSMALSIFGVDPIIFGIVMTICLSCMIGILAYFYTGSIALSTLGITATLFISALLFGFIPIWIPALQFILSLGTILLNGPSTSEAQSTAESLDQWIEYGNKLKAGYAAKFGGENTGFNDEVDSRIAIMQNLKHGFTHTIARDWLKRMERFTESK